MKKKKNDNHTNKKNQSQKQHEESWVGNPDDHEPTKKVERDEMNP